MGLFDVINYNLNRENADPTIKKSRDTHTAIIFAGDCNNTVNYWIISWNILKENMMIKGKMESII